MARIPYPDPAALQPRTQEILGKIPPLNVFRMMAHGEGLLESFSRFGNYLLAKGDLDPVLREIAIIRVGVLSGARYEVQQHDEIGRKLGMSAALIAAVHEGPDAAGFDGVQRLVMALTDDVVANVRASDATFEPLRQLLPAKQLQELIMCIGFYMAVSRFLETFDVDLEPEPESVSLKLPGMA